LEIKEKIRRFQRHKLEPYYSGPYIIKEIIWNALKKKIQEDRTGIIFQRNVHIKTKLFTI